ncbi:MAG: O-antigen/teichoic acid export membrane protein [Saprospiraceae bacterium]
MSLVKQLAGQTVIYGLGQILPRIVQFILFSTYLTNLLNDTGDYAVYLDLYAYATVLIVFFSYRMDTALFRFGRKSEELEEVYQSAFWPMVISSLLLVVAGWIFSEAIATWLTYPGKGYYVKWFSWIIGLDVMILLPMAKLRLMDQPRKFITYKIGNVILTIALVLFFLEVVPRWFPSLQDGILSFANGPVEFVFASNLIASAVLFVALAINYLPNALSVNWAMWRRMGLYAWPLVIVGIAGGINQFFGVPLQKYLLGEAIEINKDQAGIYGAVQKIPALLALFTTAYNYAAEPFFFKNAENKDSKSLYGDIALFFIVVAGVITLSISLGIDLFGHLIAEPYREGLYLVPILLLAYLFLGIYYNVSIWYKLSDNTIYGAYIALVGAAITIGGSLLLLPIIGFDASAWVALACYFTMVALAYLIGRKKYPIDYPIQSMCRQVILIIAIMALGYLLRGDSIFFNLGIGLLLMLTYICLSYKFEWKRLKPYI